MENVDPVDIVKIVQQYSPYVKYLSNKYFVKGGTEDDLFEEGIIGILQACKNYNGESLFEDKFSSFVKICIKRQILDAVKKSNAQKNKALNESISYSSFDFDGNEKSMLEILSDRNFSNDPLDFFIDKEKIEEKLKICEKELNDFEKQVLRYYLDGQKQSEIAKTMNKEVKKIENTLQRIKAKVKTL